MIAIKLINTATPSGNSVPFWILQTWLLGWNFGVFVTLAGIMMITTASAIMFIVDPHALNRAIQSVGMLEMQAWMIIIPTVRRKVW